MAPERRSRKGANPFAVLKRISGENVHLEDVSRKGANPFAVLKPETRSKNPKSSEEPQRGQPFRGIETQRSFPCPASSRPPQRGLPFRGIETTPGSSGSSSKGHRRKGTNPFAALNLSEAFKHTPANLSVTVKVLTFCGACSIDFFHVKN